MPDLYLKAATEADMTAALTAADIITEDGTPAPGVSLDVIGPITRIIGTDEAGDPIVQTYPEWHVNVRCGPLSDDQAAILAPVEIVPPETPFRVWG